MKSFVIVLLSFLILSFLSGCIVFHKVSYEIKLNNSSGGTVTMLIYNLRSDAESDDQLEQDKDYLFNYMLKSEEFLSSMKTDGKDIKLRELNVENGALNGKVVYHFSDVTRIEGINYEDGFYYLTVPVEDSIISTNGEVITSKDYKRILWDSSFKTLKFEMLSESFKNSSYKRLAPFYKKED
jgi:hypothetical protein